MKKLDACMLSILCALAGGALAQDAVATTESTPPAMVLKASKERVSKLLLSQGEREWIDAEDGIRFQDVSAGTGNPVVPEAIVFLKWDMFDGEGWGIEIKADHGKTTSQFVYGVADTDMLADETVLRSFEKGIATMREGGRRLVWVRSDKAYGKEGSGDDHIVVPPDTDIVFEVSLMWVRKVDPRRYSESGPASRALPHPAPDEAKAAGDERGDAKKEE